MTAADYRAIGTQCELFDVGSSLWFLREIAAQLAELNEFLRTQKVSA